VEEYNRILIPTDGSAGAEKAAGKGVSLAKLIGADVVALYVKDFRLYAGLQLSEEMVFVGEGPEGEGDRALEFVEAEAKKRGVAYKGIKEEGHPPTKIVEVANREGCDLIVMGTHGRTGLAHFFLGSVAESVIHHANCPVFIVRERSKKCQERSGGAASANEP